VKTFVILGALNMFLSVALGAFGAHGLKNKLSPEMLAIYQTGVHYHMIHALGLVIVALLFEKLGGTAQVQWSGWLLFFGIVVFSGSLYALSLSGIRVLGAITPIGGVSFLIGWILLIMAGFKIR
jgi:uncharacterized membrane protein YgdD (TMEM256/DUF423 family)